jgi:hypothetical protein
MRRQISLLGSSTAADPLAGLGEGPVEQAAAAAAMTIENRQVTRERIRNSSFVLPKS